MVVVGWWEVAKEVARWIAREEGVGVVRVMGVAETVAGAMAAVKGVVAMAGAMARRRRRHPHDMA